MLHHVIKRFCLWKRNRHHYTDYEFVKVEFFIGSCSSVFIWFLTYFRLSCSWLSLPTVSVTYTIFTSFLRLPFLCHVLCIVPGGIILHFSSSLCPLETSQNYPPGSALFPVIFLLYFPKLSLKAIKKASLHCWLTAPCCCWAHLYAKVSSSENLPMRKKPNKSKTM